MVRRKQMSRKQWKTKGKTVTCKGCNTDYFKVIDPCEDGYCNRCKSKKEKKENEES